MGKQKAKNPLDLVHLERIGNGVACLFLNNPPLNIFTLEMCRALDFRLSEARNDLSIRVLIVTDKSHKIFGAGSDIKEFNELMKTNTIIERKLRYENEVFSRLEDLPQPTIAAINGYALGGALEMALCCDFRIGALKSKYGSPEIKLGLFPGSGGLFRLNKILNNSRTKEILLLGNMIDADKAYQWGLLDRLLPKEEDVFNIAIEFANTIAARPGRSVKIIKKALKNITDMDRKEAIELSLELSDHIFKSYDASEGIQAFIEKREPVFKHE